MRFLGVTEGMYFVPDRRAAADWYARLFDVPVSCLEDPEHFYLRVGAQEIWFLKADEKSSAGTGGQVAYWQVDDFEGTLARAQEMGAVLHRGPLDRQDGFFMCQVRDPFGCAIGLIGPKPAGDGT